jgi:Holliday junction resolvase-like predicted endonuclease
MNSIEQKRKAIQAARLYLEMRGYRVLEQNFRRPGAQVPIVADKDNCLFFVDVAYFASDEQLAADSSHLSADQVRQLKRGAVSWIEETKWQDTYQFAMVEVAGSGFIIMGFIDKLF